MQKDSAEGENAFTLSFIFLLLGLSSQIPCCNCFAVLNHLSRCACKYNLAASCPASVKKNVLLFFGQVTPLDIGSEILRSSVYFPIVIAFPEGREIEEALVICLLGLDYIGYIKIHNLADTCTGRAHTVRIVK